MFNFKEIIENDRLTYYNYANNLPNSLVRYRVVTVALSIFFTAFTINNISYFQETTLKIFPILTGFSFTVLIFLMNQNELDKSQNTSLENKIRIEKINKLHVELFYNISYFIFSSLIFLIVALSISFPSIPSGIAEAYAYFRLINLNTILQFSDLANKLGSFILNFLFFYLLIESSHSFLRIIERVNYFFKKRLEIRSIINAGK